MRVLFVENDDSFSWNVVDALPFAWEDIGIVSGADRSAVATELATCDAVVIGPGPTDPVRTGLVALVTQVAERHLPLLGICLGHQAIGMAFGAELKRATPCHGKQSKVTFDGSRFVADQSLLAMRYHSLTLDAVPSPLRCTGRTADALVMAIEHESLPILGLQFHPDSFGTPGGRELLARFFEAVR